MSPFSFALFSFDSGSFFKSVAVLENPYSLHFVIDRPQQKIDNRLCECNGNRQEPKCRYNK